MAGTDAIRSTAIARGEVRAGLERLQYHLSRGPTKGKRGIAYEVRRLDALHRQATRLGGRAVGTTVVTSAGRSFGADALAALQGASPRELGRVKSSILADFSADGLEASRMTVTRGGGTWVWVANSSACPSCLSEHGNAHTGEFVPLHPSCLCIPEPVDESEARPLKAHEIIDMQEKYGADRYAKLVQDVKSGRRRIGDLKTVEAVNKGQKGKDAVIAHRAEGVGQQVALAGPPPEPVFLPNADEALAKARATQVLDEAAQLDEAIAAATSVVDDGVRVQHPSTYGIKMPRAKDRRALIEEAFERLNTLPASQRKLYHELLEDLYSPAGAGRFPDEAGRGVHFRVATDSTKSLSELGKAGIMQDGRGRLMGGSTKLTLQMSRRTKEWLEWLPKNNKAVKGYRRGTVSREELKAILDAEPPKFRLATPDELADVIVHEMGHLADYTKNAAAGNVGYAKVPPRIKDEVRKMAWDGKPPSQNVYDETGKVVGIKRNTDVGERLISYDYATSSDAETIAELHKFYYRGVGYNNAEGLAPGNIGKPEDVFLTAAEWRAKHPVLVEWLEEEWGLTP